MKGGKKSNIFVPPKPTSTLYATHTELIKKMDNNIDKLPELKEELSILEKQLQELQDQQINEFTVERMNQIKSLEKNINQTKQSISSIPHSKTNYYLTNGPIIMAYSGLSSGSGSSKKIKKVSLKDIFKKKKITIKKEDEKSSRAEYHRQYLANVDENFVNVKKSYVNEDNFCEDCQEFRVLVQTESRMVCEECGSESAIIMESDKPSLKDPPPETRYYEYKRGNHFTDWLAILQGKESSEVPDDVINVIWMEIKRERITDLAVLTEEDIKRFLGKHSNEGYNRYFKHSTQILFKINGIPPLTLSAEQEKNLDIMFSQIQEPYERHRPEGRSNFSSYSYIITKFSELLGYYDVVDKLKPLKDKDKIYQLDVIWKKICHDMGGAERGWKFIPSY